MPKKLRPLPLVLNLINEFTDEQRADLLDYLRGKQPKKERKASRKVEKPPKVDTCVTCGMEEPHFDHTKESDVYHVFRTSLKSKAATETK